MENKLFIQFLINFVDLSIFLIFVLIILFYLLRSYIQNKYVFENNEKKSLIIGFFHPYCNAGGGGERVLWCAIKALEQLHKNLYIVIYTGDQVDDGEILKNVESTFGIKFELNPSFNIRFVHLNYRRYIEDKLYPHFTILFQSLGSAFLSLEALYRLTPDVFIDTTGFAFSYPVAKYIGDCKVISYTHYPTITSNMIHNVEERKDIYNNSRRIAQSPVLSYIKVKYYQFFLIFYSFCGRCADLIFVNGSWTENHILELWKVPEKTIKLFPPCDCSKFIGLPIGNRNNNIISIGQFRPEKDYPKQIEAFRLLLDRCGEKYKDLKLILIGGIRNEEDKRRVEEYKNFCKERDLNETNVEFIGNCPYEKLIKLCGESKIGLHSMDKEHFGICVVELMASGLITVAHNSAGPKLDIIQNENVGFLAETEKEYADTMYNILELSESSRNEIAEKARKKAMTFSQDVFITKFLEHMKAFL